MPVEAVGELAASHQFVLHELTVRTESLEDAFLDGDGGRTGIPHAGGAAVILTIRSEWLKLRTRPCALRAC